MKMENNLEQVIYSEKAKSKEYFRKGVYSIEFFLGHLTGMLSLAQQYNLNDLVSDIKTDMHQLIRLQDLSGSMGSNHSGREVFYIVNLKRDR